MNPFYDLAGRGAGGSRRRALRRLYRRQRQQIRSARPVRMRRAGRLRAFLGAALCLELAAGTWQLWAAKGPDIRFLRREEACCVEWIKPEEEGGKTAGEREVYGIRLRPDRLELEFYRRIREVLQTEPGSPAAK